MAYYQPPVRRVGAMRRSLPPSTMSRRPLSAGTSGSSTTAAGRRPSVESQGVHRVYYALRLNLPRRTMRRVRGRISSSASCIAGC